MTASSTIIRYEVVDQLISCLLDGEKEDFMKSENVTVANYIQQANIFLATISSITILSDQKEIDFYNPKATSPCLCKIASAIIGKSAPNFYRNHRSLYDYLINRYHFSSEGEENLRKSKSLSSQIKKQQFERLLEKHNIVKKVRDFDGNDWVERAV